MSGWTTLLLPALILGVLGWAVPRALARVWPEGVRPLVWLGVVSALLTLLAGMGFFLILNALQGIPPRSLFADGPIQGLVTLARLSLSAAIIWAPILVLTVAGLPKRWTEETW